MSLIEIRNLTKDFGERRILENINLKVERGDVLAVVGNSSCGKTTLLRCMNLLTPPTSGQVFIGGEEITAPGADVDRIRRRMGMVYQHFNLFSHLNALENVALAPRLLNRLSRKQAAELGMKYLRMVGMQERANRRVSQLSGGQKQRVAIARAQAMEPEVMLFDEPTSALDPTMADEVLAAIRSLVKSGMTCVIVTHEMEFARGVATRIIFLSDRTIYEEGTPEEFFEHPLRKNTQAFVRRVKLFRHETTVRELDLYTLSAQLGTYCAKYNFSKQAANHVSLLAEELLTFLQQEGTGPEPILVQVNYEEKTGRKEFVLRDRLPGGNHLESPRLSALSAQLIHGSASEIHYSTENGCNVLTMTVKE